MLKESTPIEMLAHEVVLLGKDLPGPSGSPGRRADSG